MILREYKDIEHWLNDYLIFDYSIVPDKRYGHIVNCSGDVHIMCMDQSKHLGVKFGYVAGNFVLHNGNLKSLLGSPDDVGGDFDCANNSIGSLEYLPKFIGGSIDCSHNCLRSLKYCNENVNGSFNCSQNWLSSLEYGPVKVKGNFDASENALESLKYCPKYIKDNMFLMVNAIDYLALDELPKFLGGLIDLSANPIKLNDKANCLVSVLAILESQALKKKINDKKQDKKTVLKI